MWGKRHELLFPSAAEVEFIRIFGGKYWQTNLIKDRTTGRPFTLVLDLGVILKRELVEREVRVGRYFIDFGAITPYDRKGIKIEPRADIVRQQDDRDYFGSFGWHLFHLEAASVFREPMRVQSEVLKYLAR